MAGGGYTPQDPDNAPALINNVDIGNAYITKYKYTNKPVIKLDETSTNGKCRIIVYEQFEESIYSISTAHVITFEFDIINLTLEKVSKLLSYNGSNNFEFVPYELTGWNSYICTASLQYYNFIEKSQKIHSCKCKLKVISRSIYN